jgi:hypothetical protein
MAWKELFDLRLRVPKLVDDKIGACVRLCRQVFTPALRERCEGTFDVGLALRAGKMILLDGSNDGSVSKQSASAIYGMWDIAIRQALEQHFARTGKPTPTIVVWEEAAALNLISGYEIDMCREGRKVGLIPWIVSQDLGFATPEIKAAVKGCTVRHEYYNPGNDELALEAGRDLAYRKLNPLQVLRVRDVEQQRHAGFKPVKRVAKTTGERGDSTTESEGMEAQYETVIRQEEDLLSLNDQILLEVTKLVGMAPGYLMFCQGKRVTENPVYVEVPHDPYPIERYPGLADKLFARAVRQSQESAYFRTPVPSEPLWTPPPPPKPKPKGNASRVRGRKPANASSGSSTK